MEVAGRHAWHAEPLRKPRQSPVASPIPLEERALQLDAEPIGTEGLQQPPQGGLVLHAPPRAPAQADETLGELKDGFKCNVRLRRRPRPLPRMRVRTGQDPAEVRPARGIRD